MYHVEMRQFPHNFCHFNMTEQELRGRVLRGWAQGDWVELGERKWNPAQAQLTVLEGPRIPVEQLSMGRGWPNARRHGKDVTERLLAAERQASVQAQSARSSLPGSGLSTSEAVDQTPTGKPSTEQLARELLGLLGEDPRALLRAWQLALESHPERTPSECLALAEGFVGR